MEKENRKHSKTFSMIVSAIASILGLALGGLVGLCIGFILLFLLFADGTSFYFLLQKYFPEPETVVLLMTAVSFALAGGIIGFIYSLKR